MLYETGQNRADFNKQPHLLDWRSLSIYFIDIFVENINTCTNHKYILGIIYMYR